MKKSLFVLLGLAFASFAFSQGKGIADYLDNAKVHYKNGDLQKAIDCISSAKDLCEMELSKKKGGGEYIEIDNWDVVKLKKEQFIGKKVKTKVKFYSIHNDRTLGFSEIPNSCTFDKSLIDKVLKLKDYQEYTIYGTLMGEKISPISGRYIIPCNPYIHIERIDGVE